MTPSRLFAALGHPNFRRYWAAQFLSQVGTWMQAVGRGWLVLVITGQPFWLGAVGAAGMLPLLFFSLFGGVAADRFPKRRVLLVTNILSALLTLLLAVLTAGGVITVAQIMVIAFLLGTVKAAEMPAHQAFVVELVGRKDLLNAIALNSSSFNTARIIGPAAAGAIIAAGGVAPCFFANALSFLPLIAVLGLMRRLPRVPRTPPAPVLRRVAEGLAYVRRERRVQGLVAMVAAASFFGFPYLTMMPSFARDVFDIGPGGLGTMLTASGAGAVAGALLLASGAWGRRTGGLVAGAGLAFSASLTVFAGARSLAVAIPALVAAGWAMVTLAAAANTLVQSLVPDELRGRVMSVFSMVLLGMMPLGNLLVGSVAGVVGTPGAVALSATALGVAVAAVALRRREILAL